MTDNDPAANDSTNHSAERPNESNDRNAIDDASSVSTDPVVTVSEIGHRFDDLTVLEDVSFELDTGTVTALVGPNGCGKTTLLRIVAGVLAQTTGTIDRPGVERPFGYLPQRPDFRAAFTVRETIEFYGALLSETIDVQAALETVGLQAVADRRVDELSGGMRRLLGLAQATLGSPPVALLDEPTGDLDPRMTEYMFDVIVNRADDTAVLLATHNLAGAVDADQVIVMDEGHVVAHDSPAGIMEQTETDTFRDGFLELVGTEPTVGGGSARTETEASQKPEEADTEATRAADGSSTEEASTGSEGDEA